MEEGTPGGNFGGLGWRAAICVDLEGGGTRWSDIVERDRVERVRTHNTSCLKVEETIRVNVKG